MIATATAPSAPRSCAGARDRRASPGCRSCSSPATTTARSRRSWTTRPRPCRCRRRSPRSARWPRCRRPRSRSSPAGRCATSPRCPACRARCISSAATARSSTSASSSGSRPRWSRCATGWRELARSTSRTQPGRPAGAEAGQRRGAHCAPPRRTSPSRSLDAVRSGPATWPDVHVTTGKEVIELSVVATHKGTARRRAAHAALGERGALPRRRRHRRERVRASCTARTSASRSGTGDDRRRAYRVDDPESAAYASLGLVLRRAGALALRRAGGADRAALDAGQRPHASRCVTPDATVTWLCHPRPTRPPSSPTCSAADSAGYFSVAPGRPRRHLPLGQRYRPGTMTVETRWSGLTVTDWLDRATDADATSTLVRVLTGSVRVAVEFAPRPEFGQVPIAARSRSATACACSAPTSRSRCTRPASSGRSSTRAATTPRTPSWTWPWPAARCVLELRLRVRPASTRRRSDRPSRDRQAEAEHAVARLVGHRCGCRRWPAIWCCAAR